ncbi:MAG: protein kinase, partial [Terriglobales bacterium]
MALTAGTKLGPYEIQSPLGAGGMGEVYRARDTRLDRTVAVKILPSHLSENPEARQRFDREARAISSLNHPNICTLHDVGHQDGVDFLVMECLEGETLADRLRKGPLASDQLLKYGIEICEGLEQAHRTGVVHRDLKPGNVMLTKAGAKLMDFGLAKAVEPAMPPASSLTMTRSTPAGSQPLTARGTVVGTFQYMSPEQVEGKEADARSDIFALGAVLYEMATGKRAFDGKTTASVIAAVLERNPPSIASVQPMSPPALAQVVKTCLAKDPDDRFQNVHDVKLQLQWIAEGGSQAGVAAPVISTRKRRERTMWIGAAVVMAMLAAWLGWQLGPRGSSGVPVHLSVMLPAGKLLVNTSTEPVAISPDGTSIVYSAFGDDNKAQLYLRKLGDFEGVPIAGTDGGVNPFFSPNGEWLAFVSAEDGNLKKVLLRGGSAVVVADPAFGLGGTWADDGTIYFNRGFTAGVYAVPSEGGQPRQVLQPGSTPDDRAQLWPDALPGGNGLIFTVWTGRSFNEARIEALSFKTGKRKVLIEGGTGARYLSSGHL